MTVRGLRNNNPLNIRKTSERFLGEVDGVDRSFKTFSTMAYGYRAGFVILGTYINKGFNTIEKIITRWAPPTENDTWAYIRTVEENSKIPFNEVLSLNDGEKLISVVIAMSWVENGVKAKRKEVEAGFYLQSKITKKRNTR